MLLANDMETFQKIMSKMHQSIVDLQDINKDVLLGKKNPNCLSCNKGKDGFETMSHVKGQDGRMYLTSGAANMNKSKFDNKTDIDTNMSDAATKVIVLNSNSQIMSPNMATSSNAGGKGAYDGYGFNTHTGSITEEMINDAKLKHNKSKSSAFAEGS